MQLLVILLLHIETSYILCFKRKLLLRWICCYLGLIVRCCNVPKDA